MQIIAEKKDLYQKSDKAEHTTKELAKVAGVSHDTIQEPLSAADTMTAKQPQNTLYCKRLFKDLRT